MAEPADDPRKGTLTSSVPQKTGAPEHARPVNGPIHVHPARAKLYSKANVDGLYIAITFDDGPDAVLTSKLLGILKKNNVRATFFVVGRNAAKYPKIVNRILTEHHAIGNHTYTHPKTLMSQSDEFLYDQIVKTQEAVSLATGFTPFLFRPPYGNITARQRELVERKLNLKVIGWSVDPEDWREPGPAVVADRILQHVHRGAIILCHDIHSGTIDAMPKTLVSLINKGYRFLTVDELRSYEIGKGDWPIPSRDEAPV